MSERQHVDSQSNDTTNTHPTNADHPDEQAYVKQAQEFERAPDDFQADTEAEELQVPDYPVVVDVGKYGEASAYLATWGLIEDLQQSQGEQVSMNARRVAEILRDHYVSPSFETLGAEDVRRMHIDAPDKYLGAIMPGMDAQMQADGSATVQSDRGN